MHITPTILDIHYKLLYYNRPFSAITNKGKLYEEISRKILGGKRPRPFFMKILKINSNLEMYELVGQTDIIVTINGVKLEIENKLFSDILSLANLFTQPYLYFINYDRLSFILRDTLYFYSLYTLYPEEMLNLLLIKLANFIVNNELDLDLKLLLLEAIDKLYYKKHTNSKEEVKKILNKLFKEATETNVIDYNFSLPLGRHYLFEIGRLPLDKVLRRLKKNNNDINEAIKSLNINNPIRPINHRKFKDLNIKTLPFQEFKFKSIEDKIKEYIDIYNKIHNTDFSNKDLKIAKTKHNSKSIKIIKSDDDDRFAIVNDIYSRRYFTNVSRFMLIRL